MNGERKQAVGNLTSSVFLFAIQTVVSLLFTRYLVRSLGVEAYGMIPLATSVVPYLTLVSVGLSASLGRHFTIAWARGDRNAASSLMDTAFTVSIAAVVVALTLGTGLILAARSGLRIPASLMADATLLFAAVTASAASTVVKSLTAVVPFAEGRIDIDNYATLADVSARVALVVAAFWMLGPSLRVVALGIVAGALAGLAVNIGAWRRFAPWLKPHMRRPDVSSLRELVGTGTWVVVNQLGAILFLATDLIIINIMLGPTVAGLYGTVILWVTFLRGYAGALSGFLTPLMVRSFAAQRQETSIATAASAVKCVGLAVALPIGLVAGLAAPILNAWLGAGFVTMAPVLTALVLHLCINLAVVPLFSVQIAHNRLAVPGIVTVFAGLANIGLSILWARAWPNALGVALGTAVALTAKNAVFTPWYAARVQGAPSGTYFRQLVPAVGMTALVFALSAFVARGGLVVSLASMVVYGVVIVVVYVAIVWFLLLTRRERDVFSDAFARGAGTVGPQVGGPS